jgi:hypothetical protein
VTPAEALAWCRRITGGEGLDRDSYIDRVPRGNVAEHLWNDGAFTLGLEYGALIALVEAFGLNLNEDDPKDQRIVAGERIETGDFLELREDGKLYRRRLGGKPGA